jgi:hypothetical protein
MNFEWTYLILIWMFIGGGLLSAMLWLLFRPNWMGFSGKTLWDWFVILAVPAVVGFATLFISAGQARINLARAEEEAVQQYIDRISELALAGYFTSGALEAVAVGRAQTLAVLQIVDGARAGRVLQFLGEIGLVQLLVTEIEELNFAGAQLKGLPLSGIDMEDVNLAGADLEEADLSGADLEEVDFRYADLKGANLSGVTMADVLLKGAALDHTDLRGANLADASGLEEDELARACLDASTVLPPGLIVRAWTGCSGDILDDD